MCGIVGYRPVDPQPVASEVFGRLMLESAIRGHHAYGIASSIGVEELAVERRHDLRFETFDVERTTVGHTRYSTSGDWKTDANNQPVVVHNMALAFNGVISMGTKEEFEKQFDVLCATYNDGEVFLRRLLRGDDALTFLKSVTGSFAGVWLADGKLFALRNSRRPMWTTQQYGAVWYASTLDIFKRAGFNVQLLRQVPALEVQ